MKISLITILIVLGFSLNAQAQEQGKFRAGLDLGAAFPSAGVGALGDVELKYNLQDKMNVGFRFGTAIITKNLKLDSGNDFESGDFSGNASFMATYDYYFGLVGSFHPFVGGGLGLNTLASVAGKEGEEFDKSKLDTNSKFGGFLRGGFEASKFRMTVEYDFIGESTLQDVYGNKVGSIKNSYLGVTVGFYVGGGKW